MCPFGKNDKPEAIFEDPRYKEKPVLLLFEILVLDVIGRLSPERRQGVQELNVQKIFNTKSEHWKSALREILQLSTTIETAILNTWYTKLDENGGTDENIDTEAFSKEFSDRYFEEGSQIDTWPEGALEKAKEFIAEYRKKGL